MNTTTSICRSAAGEFAPCWAEARRVLTRAGVGLHVLASRREAADTLVILNNFFMVADHWAQFVPRLHERARIVNYDLRHQGKSDRVEGPISLDDHVEDLREVLDALGLERAVLLGTCISTMIAREFALRYPQRVAGLVMVGPIFGPFGDQQRRFMHRTLLASLRSGGAEQLFDHYYPLLYTARTIAKQRTGGYLALKMAFVENNPAEQLERHLKSTLALKDDPADLVRIAAPTFFLAGEEDFLTSPDALRTMCADMPNATHELIPSSGHNPYVETPEAFQSAVIGWLSGPGRSRQDAVA